MSTTIQSSSFISTPTNPLPSFEAVRDGYIAKGDCLELMKEIPDQSIDMILCDLPYGTIAAPWDTIIDFSKLWAQYNRIKKPDAAVVLTASAKFTIKLAASNFDSYKYKYTWQKNVPVGFLNAKKQPLRKTEDVLVFYDKQPTYNPQMTAGKPYTSRDTGHSTGVYRKTKGYSGITVNTGTRYPTDIITIPTETDRFHPTQKPVALCEWLIKTYTNAGETVLDNCFGSGSTLVAAQKTGRKFVGIELNQNTVGRGGKIFDYYQEAKQRIISA